MIDREEIASMIRDIETYLSDLQAMGISKKSELEEKERYYAVSMIVFAVMNRAVDIGNEIISGSPQIPMPGTYKETFDLLQKHKIISAPVAEKMNKLMKYRNVIAHEYYRLSAGEIYKLANDLLEVEKFVGEIKKYLRTAGST